MSFVLNEKIRNLTPYSPVEGEYGIRLDANESYFSLSEEILEEVKEAVGKVAFNRYPDPFASELCEAFANFYGIDKNFVTAGNGSDELISVIMNAFLQKGDKVMTVTPDFSMYAFYASIVEAQCVDFLKTNLEFSVDNVIKEAKEQNIRALIFSNPCNPTSLGVKRDEMRKLISSLDCLVVLDEAYMDFWDESLIDEGEKYGNLIILRTCSKAFGLAAMRLGFAVANKTLTDVIRSVKSPYNVNSLSQAAGTAVLKHADYLKACTESIKKSRDELYEMITSLSEKYKGKIKPIAPVTNFVYTEFEKAGELFEFLKTKGIAVRKMGTHLRISAGSEEENRAVCEGIDLFYKS